MKTKIHQNFLTNINSPKLALVLVLLLLSCVLTFSACVKNKKNEKAYIAFVSPQDWPQPFYSFANNPVTKEKFVLGRTLFYDVQLSINNTISCGSCHKIDDAFAQKGAPVSKGIFDRLGKRNAPPLFNLAWHTSFFWDGRANNLEVQPLNPIGDHNEMGETLLGIITKLRADQHYAMLFKDAYGDTIVNSQRILRSLAIFMGTMVSNNAKYDQYKRGETSLDDAEMRGLHVFENNCASCHPAPLFTDFSFRSNGLPLVNSSQGTIDSGRAGLPPYDPNNLYAFKVPTLRNLKYTAPYMHDGRMATLDQVINHYGAVPNTVNLDPILSNGIHLNPGQRGDLLAFLNTLNDESFVKDERFAEQ